MYHTIAPVASTGSQKFLSRLKSETTIAHRKLESTTLAINLMQPEVTIGQYTAYLQAMLPVIAYTEKIIFPVAAPFLPDLNERSKFQKILEDLHVLGVQAGLNDSMTSLWHNILPNSTQALAHMYVMEGSTLGGKIISKHIAGVLGIEAGRGASYINCYGEKVGTMWKSFIGSLTAYVIKNNSEEELIAEANCVFSNLYNHFEK
jgi:heme oxygenase